MSPMAERFIIVGLSSYSVDLTNFLNCFNVVVSKTAVSVSFRGSSLFQGVVLAN